MARLSIQTLILAVSSLAFVPSLYAADDDFDNDIGLGSAAVDLIGSTDELPVEEPSTASTLRDSLSFYLENNAIYYKPRDERFENYTYASAELNYKKSNFRYLFNIFGNYTTKDGQLRGAFSEPRTEEQPYQYVDFKEAKISYEQPKYALTLGKSIVNNTLNAIGSITNRYNNYYSVAINSSKSIGLWQAKLDYFISDKRSLTLSYIPLYQIYKNNTAKEFTDTDLSQLDDENQHKKLIDAMNNYDFMVDTILLEIYNREIGASSLLVKAQDNSDLHNNFLLQYKASTDNYDFLSSLYYGPTRTLVAKQLVDGANPVYSLEQPRIFGFSFGASTTINSHMLGAEVYYQHAINRKDDDVVEFSLSYSNQFPDIAYKINAHDIHLFMSASMSRVVLEQDEPGYVFGYDDIQTGTQTINITGTLSATPRLSFSMINTFDYEERVLVPVLAMSYKYTDNLNFDLGYTGFNYQRQQFIMSKIKYYF